MAGREMTQLLEHGAAEPAVVSEKVAPIQISVVIVTWNSAQWIESCLRSVARSAARLGAEVIVLDNGSTDASILLAESASFPGMQIVANATNDGFAAGVNRAIALSHGDYVVLLNPDCELEVDTLAALKRFLDQRPEAAAAVPLLIGPDGQPQRDFQLRLLPTLGSFAMELLMLDKLLPANALSTRHRYRELDISQPVRIEQPAAAAMMLRRSVAERLGPFDERFNPAWFEDVDYCRRLREAGGEIWLVPAARANHRGGASLEHISFGTFTEIWYRNLYRYATKWFRPRQVELLRWLIMAGMSLRMIATTLGMASSRVSRRERVQAYRRVLRQAFDRWTATSRSS